LILADGDVAGFADRSPPGPKAGGWEIALALSDVDPANHGQGESAEKSADAPSFHKTGCVQEQDPGERPADDPDRLIKWFVGVVVVGVGVKSAQRLCA
jgi:hypothetical protein